VNAAGHSFLHRHSQSRFMVILVGFAMAVFAFIVFDLKMHA
jgi:hypothetical protein